MANTKLPARLLDTSAVPALNVTGDLTVDTTTLKVDSSNNRVGIGTASPTGSLHLSSANADHLYLERSGHDTFRIALSHSVGLGIYNVTDSRQDVMIDGSGRVGIGTTAPGNLLEIAAGSGTDAGITIKMGSGNSGANDSFIGFENSSGTEIIKTRYDNPTTSYVISSDTTGDILTVQRGGNVGIQNTSPSSLVHLGSNSTSGAVDIGLQNSSRFYTIKTDSGDLLFRDESAGSERMRLSSAGTFLIGKTAEGTATDGIELNRNDVLVATRDGDAPLLLNRRSSDGDIALLRKDNANVGSIGVSGGNNIYISGSQTNHAGLTFATDAVLPTRQEVAIDNVTDLGASSERFKDGYFSGSIYLGGNTSNGLDDYEEGSWTPTATTSDSNSSISVSYTHLTLPTNREV